jgi:hypothetical protein
MRYQRRNWLLRTYLSERDQTLYDRLKEGNFKMLTVGREKN